MVDLTKSIQIDGDKLKKIRKSKLLRVNDTAKLLNMNQKAYWLIENNYKNNRSPKLNTLARLVVLLDCKIEDIITDESIEILDYIRNYKNF